MSSALEARQMLRAHRYGVLSTLSKKFDGHPFGSITPYLVGHDGSLIIFISSLAEHTKNIKQDPRVSLTTHDQHNPHVLSQGRVTLLGDGHLEPDRAQVGQRYIRYFPEAESYMSMHDFAFYRIHPLAIRYIGGFGKIHWVDIKDYVLTSHPLIEQEAGVIQHMNTDHQEALSDYCRHFHQYTAKDVAMLGIDMDGFDVRADGRVLRFNFPQLVTDAHQARSVLVEMVKSTRL